MTTTYHLYGRVMTRLIVSQSSVFRLLFVRIVTRPTCLLPGDNVILLRHSRLLGTCLRFDEGHLPNVICLPTGSVVVLETCPPSDSDMIPRLGFPRVAICRPFDVGRLSSRAGTCLLLRNEAVRIVVIFRQYGGHLGISLQLEHRHLTCHLPVLRKRSHVTSMDVSSMSTKL